ncbi:MAG: serine/threonine phosphatase [Xenococcaceae cyanobacterium]
MLICPHCQSENPEVNKFCRSCGSSLEYKICHNCETSIPLEAKQCSNCGASVQTVFWGIIAEEQPIKHKKPLPQPKQLVFSSNESPQAPIIETLDSKIKYLDRDRRYHLDFEQDEPLKPIYLSSSTSKLFQGQVIDLKPLQKSYLATIREEQTELFGELEQELDSSYLRVAQYWNLIGIPTHALPYLIMEQFTSVIPEIYDAWRYNNQGIVLLSDRSSWSLLTDTWLREDLPLMQILWSLNEILKLWNPLAQIECNISLLIKDNLRVDEDDSFCLQQLHINADGVKPSLADLGKIWRSWLNESGINNQNNLNRLIDRMIAEEFPTVEELIEQLQQINSEISEFDVNQITNEDEDLVLSSVNSAENELRELTDFTFFADEDKQQNINYDSETDEQPTMVLPMELASIVNASCTDIGIQRDHNEDFFGIQTTIITKENNWGTKVSAKGLYIVCDGMGGHAAGEVASSMAVETLQNYFQSHWQDTMPTKEIIEEGIFLANQTLYQTNIDNSRSGNGRMGTTLVMALLQDTALTIAHVGDSRIYRVTRQKGLEQLTLDHEVGQREINRGVEPEIAYARLDAYQLTQALGPRDDNYVRPEIQELEITEDSLILLCSDGLCDNDLLESHWETYLNPLISSNANLKEGLLELIDFANEYNGHDNVTAILIRIKLKPAL